MGRGVVALHDEGLSDAEMLLVSAAEQHLPRLLQGEEAVVVAVGHLHQVPFPIPEVLRRRCGYEAVGMSACCNNLASGAEQSVSAARNVQVGEPFGLDFHHRAGGSPSVTIGGVRLFRGRSLLHGARREASCQDDEKCDQCFFHIVDCKDTNKHLFCKEMMCFIFTLPENRVDCLFFTVFRLRWYFMSAVL